MRKHIAPLLFAVLLVGVTATTALADCPPDSVRLSSAAASSAEAGTPTYSGPYYPVSVEEYSEAGEARIRKIYQLSLSDDPGLIPTGSFTRDGRTYHLLDITQKDEVGVDTRDHTETITQDSDTGELSEILKVLPAQKKVTTKDGYSGTLLLDHTSIDISVKGYQTSSKNLSATRTYPSLSDADLSLIPKSITSGGASLTLGDVQWSNDGTYYTATATYTGTSTSRYATGYTVKANYTGQVAKTSCEVATYTAVFGSEPLSETPDPSTAETDTPENTPADAPAEKPAEEASPEDTPKTPSTARGHRTEEADSTEEKTEDKAEDTVDPALLARENKIMASICFVSCVIGIIGFFGLLLAILRIPRRPKEQKNRKAQEEGEEKQ